MTLEKGRDLYIDHVRRPPVLGGARAGTQKRYRPVLQKFITFSHKEGVHYWPRVSKKLLEAYGSWLDDEGYAYATEYLELTTIKQVMKWLVEEKLLPASCLFAMPLQKPTGTTTYCYTADEVDAILVYCFANPDLAWLGEVVVALIHTGLRIGELANLRWTDVVNMKLVLPDRLRQARKEQRASARTTKGRRERILPIHEKLWRMLGQMRRHSDGRVFHGPRGGVLKPDTVRNVLVREVLTPLAGRFPGVPAEPSFKDGRLHSFRHYFVSQCANNGTPEQVLMNWLGHQESKMVRRYYHLHDPEARRQMDRLEFSEANLTDLAGGIGAAG